MEPQLPRLEFMDSIYRRQCAYCSSIRVRCRNHRQEDFAAEYKKRLSSRGGTERKSIKNWYKLFSPVELHYIRRVWTSNMSGLQTDCKEWRSNNSYSVHQDTNTGVMDSECNKVTFAHSGTPTNQGRERLSTNIETSTCGPTRSTKARRRRGRRVKV